MPISFTCKACGKALKVADSLAGRAAKCPDCGNKIRVPDDKAKTSRPKPAREKPVYDDFEELDDWDDPPPRSRSGPPPKKKKKKSRSGSSNPYSSSYSEGGGGGGPGRYVRLVRVGVLSSAIMSAVSGALGGLLVGVILLVFAGIGAAAAPPGAGGAGSLLGSGAVVFITLPIFYGIAGFIGGALYACVYNIVAGIAGGIEMEFE